MKWAIDYIPEARKDIKNLDNSQWLAMRRAIEKVRQNPLPDYEGGYGKPLGNKRNINLSGCLKVKNPLSIVRRLPRFELCSNFVMTV